MKNSPMKLQTKETGFWRNNKAAKKLKEASFSNKKKNVFRGMRLKTAQLSCKQRKHVFGERKLKIARFSNKNEKRDFGAKKLKTA